MLSITCHIPHITCQRSNAYFDPWYMLNNFCFHVYAQKSLFIAKQSFYESKATYILPVITEARGNFRHMYSDNVECIYCNDCDFQSQPHLNSNMIKLFRTVPIQYRINFCDFLRISLQMKTCSGAFFWSTLYMKTLKSNIMNAHERP